MNPVRAILVGAGAHGLSCYAQCLLPKLGRESLVRTVAVVEPDPVRLGHALDALDLSRKCGFASVKEAVEGVEADSIIVASPVAAHKPAVEAATRHGLHLFIEKPVSDSFENCSEILSTVKKSGIKAAVNMSACFDQDKRAFANGIAKKHAGKIEYIFARLAWDHSAMAKHRANNPHPYLMEGGVHVLEMLRRWSGARPRRVFNLAWKSPDSVYSGFGSNLVSFEMENGVCCALEGSWTMRASRNGWGSEYFRADGDKGSLLMDQQQLYHVIPNGTHASPAMKRLDWSADPGEGDGTEYLFRKFLDWITGKLSDHPTNLQDNLQTMAMLFAACRSADTGQAVDVQELLRNV